MTYALDAERHDRLIADIANIAYTSGIPQSFIENSMVGVARQPEIDWVRGFRSASKSGAGVIFYASANAETRMMASCGALIRNFIDARCATLKQVLDSAADFAEPSVLFLLNFYTTTHGGKPLTSWQVQQVYDLLVQRLAAGKQTGLYIEDMAKLGQDYGKSMFDHLQAHYTILKA